MPKAIPVNPAMLRHAREAAGLSLDAAAARAKLPPPREGGTPADHLRMLEDGLRPVGIARLAALARAYRRPECFFFLSRPPQSRPFLADFRTIRNAGPEASPEFAALLRRIRGLHQCLRALAEDGDARPIPLVGSLPADASMPEAADRLRAILPDSRTGRYGGGGRELFRALRRHIEDAGIFVCLRGDLGSHHSAVGPETFRGLAVADPLAPLIVINPHDAECAQVFTLVHELCHILLGVSAISDAEMGADADRDEERFCNAAAAEYLVPADMLRDRLNGDAHGGGIGRIARRLGVSAAVVAIRARDLGLLDAASCNAILSRPTARNRGGSGGPDANVVARFRLGDRLLSTIVGAAREGRIDIGDAVQLLGLSASRIERILP